MDASQLKLIAIIVMLIDHIGAVIFPNIIALRVIGRLAFPIFAYFIAEGYFKTRDVKKYKKRLFLFALISQIPFYLAFKDVYYLNVFFTLFIGLCAIDVYDREKKIGYVWFLAIIAQLLNTDYGIYGVFMIYLFYRYRDDFKTMVKKQVILSCIFMGSISIMTVVAMVSGKVLVAAGVKQLLSIWMEIICLVSLILIKKYNGERGRSLKYLFYVFYPAHLLVLALIKKYVL